MAAQAGGGAPLTLAELLRRINPATRQHRACSPPMTSAEVMRAWGLYTRRIGEAIGGETP